MPSFASDRISQFGGDGLKLTTRLAYKLLPPEIWAEVFREWSLTKRRWRNSSAKARALLGGKRGLKLHLGCGRRIMPGWVNVDAFEQPGFDLRWDLRDRFPCEDGVAALIYSEHTLEHLDRRFADQALAEMFRLLEPGGTLRIGVPDAGLYMRNYASDQREFFAEFRHLGGAVEPLATPLEVINQMFRMGGHHRFAWDYETLGNALAKVGFDSVRQMPAGSASRPDLCLDDPTHANETLYLEAVKPSQSSR